MRPRVKSGHYDYIVGPATLGLGVLNLAFANYDIPDSMEFYRPGWNIKRSFSPFTGAAQFPLARSGPQFDLRANGVYMAGELNLGMLTQISQTPGNG